MNKPDKWKKETDFITYLDNFIKKNDLGALAALRRGLSGTPGTAFEMYKYLVPWVGDSSRWESQVFYLVASLFAWHQISWRQDEEQEFSNLGSSLRILKNVSNADSLERRFLTLLNADREDLHVHLKQLFGLLVAKGIPVNFVQLIKDLKNWNHESHYVQQAWANEFWNDRPINKDDGDSNQKKMSGE